MPFARECANCEGRMVRIDLHRCLQHPNCWVGCWACPRCHATVHLHSTTRKAV